MIHPMSGIFGKSVFGSYTAISRGVSSYEPVGGLGDDADKGCGTNQFWSYNNDECVDKAVTSANALPSGGGCPEGYKTDPLNSNFCIPDPNAQKKCPSGQSQTWDFSTGSQVCCPTGWLYDAGLKKCYPGTPLTSGTTATCPAGSKIGPDGFSCVPITAAPAPAPKPVVPPPVTPPSQASIFGNPLLWAAVAVAVGIAYVAKKKHDQKAAATHGIPVAS